MIGAAIATRAASARSVARTHAARVAISLAVLATATTASAQWQLPAPDFSGTAAAQVKVCYQPNAECVSLPSTYIEGGLVLQSRWDGVIDRSRSLSSLRVGTAPNGWEFSTRAYDRPPSSSFPWFQIVPHGKSYPADYQLDVQPFLDWCQSLVGLAYSGKTVTRVVCTRYTTSNAGLPHVLPLELYTMKQYWNGSATPSSYCVARDGVGTVKYFSGCHFAVSLTERPDGYRRYIASDSQLVPDYRDGDWPVQVRIWFDQSRYFPQTGGVLDPVTMDWNFHATSPIRKEIAAYFTTQIDGSDYTLRVSPAWSGLALGADFDRQVQVEYPGYEPWESYRRTSQQYVWDFGGALLEGAFYSELFDEDDVAQQWPSDYTDEATMDRVADALEVLTRTPTQDDMPVDPVSDPAKVEKPLSDLVKFLKPFREVDFGDLSSIECFKPQFVFSPTDAVTFTRTFVFDGHCEFVADHRPELEAVAMVLWAIVALFVVLRG